MTKENQNKEENLCCNVHHTLSLPDVVHKELIRNAVFNLLQEARVKRAFPDFYTQSNETLMWLLGYNPLSCSGNLRKIIKKIFERHGDEPVETLTGTYSKEKVDRIAAEIKDIINLYNV